MFSHIIGNNLVKTILQKALEKNALANTLLFHGPDGVGKGLFAKELAKKVILSEDKIGERKIDHGTHPDLHVYQPDGKTKMHSIQSMREMIDEVYKPPFEGNAKVFLIHDADRMLASSANAILKTLEEPNEDSYIVLLTSKVSELLLTIRSRCVKIGFSAISEEAIQDYLERVCEKSEGFSQYIAKMATGSIGKAHLLATQPEMEKVLESLLDILKKRRCPSIEELDDLCKDKEQESFFMEMVFSTILMWYRDRFVQKMDPSCQHVFFKEDVLIEKLPSLEMIHYWIDEVKKGIERNIKLSYCLQEFFLKRMQFT